MSCDNIPTAANPTATDNCDSNVTVSLAETETAGSCAGNFVLVRTWTATDACGNTTEATQLISVEDTDAPVLVGIPADMTAACGQALPTAASVNVTATDNCDGNVSVTFEETTEGNEGGCAAGQTIIRTWTATDACGNVSTGTQRISSSDNIPPVLSNAPIDATIECSEVPVAVTLTATDNCDANVEVSFSESVNAGTCMDSYSLIRTWTATDACGNRTEAIQILLVQDLSLIHI